MATHAPIDRRPDDRDATTSEAALTVRDKDRKLSLNEYVAICRQLVASGSSPSEVEHVLSRHQLDLAGWQAEASRWRQAIRSDATLRAEFQRLYSALDDSSPSSKTGRSTRSPWIWFGLGTALLPFAPFQTVVPIAAWLAPILLLRFARSKPARIWVPAIASSGYLATVVGTRGFFPGSTGLVMGVVGMAVVLPYAFDRWLSPQMGGVARTLVFPCAATSIDYLAGFGAFGTMGMSAYSQVGNRPLLAVSSVTGIWGIQFVIAWTASVANDAWEHGWDFGKVRSRVGIWLTAVLAIAILGGASTAFAVGQPTVMVAGLAPSHGFIETLQNLQLRPADLTIEEKTSISQQVLEPNIDDLLNRTRDAATAGARIVVWAEGAATVFEEHEAVVLERAAVAARENKIYLQIGLVSLLATEEYPTIENRAILLGPDGSVIWDYPKSTTPFGDGNLPGPGIVPVVDTPYGRLATVICFDADFPSLIRQAGRKEADIILVPASDFGRAGEMHARMSIPRATENGASIVRPARQGVSLAADGHGRLLSYQDDYRTKTEQTIYASVPTEGVSTIYSALGDWFAWSAIAGSTAALISKARGAISSRPQRKGKK